MGMFIYSKPELASLQVNTKTKAHYKLIQKQRHSVKRNIVRKNTKRMEEILVNKSIVRQVIVKSIVSVLLDKAMK